MKNKLFTLILTLSVMMMGTAKAENVDLQTARQVGAYFFAQMTGAKSPVAPEALVLAEQFDNPTLCIPAVYAFNIENGGYVVVSACDGVEPILAYAPTGSLDSETMPPACRYMLESYAKLVAENQNNNATATNEATNAWKGLVEHTFHPVSNLSKATYLVKARWDQEDPYNRFCPMQGNQHCLTGCVATAMAMIIHYWKYPVVGGLSDHSARNWHTATTTWNYQSIKYKFTLDSNKFVYDSMPNSISPRSDYNKIRAIGKLSFACGVTVKMGWSVSGSGALSQNVPEALKYFQYDHAIYKERHNASSQDASWLSLLHSEIEDNARPVSYSGSDRNGTGRDAAGHAFVLSGCDPDNSKRFYINWGWGGSSDGYYTIAPISSVETAGGYTFNSRHAIVYNIYPNSVGIEDNTEFSTVQAYPNPATEYLMIPAGYEYNMRMGVYSIDGKMVDNIVVPAGTQEYRLDVRNYPTGTYFYRLNGSACKFVVE